MSYRLRLQGPTSESLTSIRQSGQLRWVVNRPISPVVVIPTRVLGWRMIDQTRAQRSLRVVITETEDNRNIE